MTYQTGKNVLVAFKVESTFGTKPSAGSASVFRASPASGLGLRKGQIRPGEFRADGMTTQARHGSRSVEGTYEADLSLAFADALFEAVLRGTWLASFTITQATATSITTQANSITRAAGSWITDGARVGDVVRLSGFNTAANNNINLRVTALTATVMTVAETLVVDAAADTTFTLTVTKRLVMSNPPVARSFTFEEVFQDIDSSQIFKGCRICGITLKFTPDNTVMVTFKVVGQDEETGTGASSPYYTSPTVSANIPLVCVDGKIRVNGVDAVDFSAFEITYDIGGATQGVIGALVSPDVFTNNAQVTASLTALRSDLTRLNLFINETIFDIHVMCVEPEAEPKDFMSFYFGNVKVMDAQKNIGNDNAFLETLPLVIGADEAGSAVGHTSTMMQINSSAP
jgi:hypothetical protein